jgi:hypothetical protein
MFNLSDMLQTKKCLSTFLRLNDTLITISSIECFLNKMTTISFFLNIVAF